MELYNVNMLCYKLKLFHRSYGRFTNTDWPICNHYGLKLTNIVNQLEVTYVMFDYGISCIIDEVS